MIYLLCIAAILTFPSVFRVINVRKANAYYICAVTLLMIFIIGLRDPLSMNIDVTRYESYYRRVSALSFKDAVLFDTGSPLYYLLGWLFAKCNIPFQGFMFSLAASEMGIIGRYLKKYSISPVMSFLVFLGTGGFTFLFYGMRQSVSMIILLLCFEYLINKNYLKMVIGLLLAFGFHPTAIVFIPILIASILPINKLTILFYSFIFAVCLAFRSQLGAYITMVFYDNYLNYYESVGTVGGMTLLYLILTMLYCFLCYENIRKKKTHEYYLAIGMIILTIMQVFSSFAYSFTRINIYYCLMIMTIAVPKLVDSLGQSKLFGRSRCVVKFGFVLMFSIVMISIFWGSLEGEQIIDYSFFWEGL